MHFLWWNCQIRTRDPRVVQVCMLGAAPCFLLKANSNPFPDIRLPFLRWFIQEVLPAHDVLGTVVRTGNHVGFRFCWKRTQTEPLTSLLDGCQWLPTAYSHRQTPYPASYNLCPSAEATPQHHCDALRHLPLLLWPFSGAQVTSLLLYEALPDPSKLESLEFLWSILRHWALASSYCSYLYSCVYYIQGGKVSSV